MDKTVVFIQNEEEQRKLEDFLYSEYNILWASGSRHYETELPSYFYIGDPFEYGKICITRSSEFKPAYKEYYKLVELDSIFTPKADCTLCPLEIIDRIIYEG